MPSRRQFLSGAAGVVFSSCALLDQAHAQAAKPKRREVKVGGKRIRTIDIHAHVVVPEATALLGQQTSATDTGVMAGEMAEARFAKMDEWGTDMQALSINATWYGAEREVVTKVIQIQNEKLAELCAKYPDRFVAFASVAMQFPDLAAQQLEEGVKKYNLRGAAIGGHANNDEFSNPKFDVFWRKAEELGCLIFSHPQGVPELAKRFGGAPLANIIGNPLETTLFLEHLVYDGTLDKFPGLKICGAHGGGYFPSYAARSDYGCNRFPEACKPLKKKPTEYLRQLYVDTMVFTPEALRHLIAETGISQIMIGTDYPFAWSETVIDHVLKTPGLSDNDKRAILSENAARLLKIKI